MLRLAHLGLLLHAALAAAEPVILVPSGTVVDGRGLASFATPVSDGTGGIVFRGASTGVYASDDATAPRVAGSGDVLPSPLVGTFNEMLQAARGADGTIGFLAELNAAQASTGLFLTQGSGTTLVSLREGLRGFALASAGVVAFTTATDVYRWTAAVGEQSLAASLALKRVIGAPLFDGQGGVLWRVSSRNAPGGLYRWQSTIGPGLLVAAGQVIDGLTIRDFARAGLAVDAATGVLAFAVRVASNQLALFRTDLSTGLTTVVARSGDAVIGAAATPGKLTNVDPTVSFDADGAIVARARVQAAGASSSDRRYVRVTPTGLAETTAPVAEATTVPIRSSEGLYELRATVIAPVLRTGDVIAPGATVDSLDTYAAGGGAVAARVHLSAGRTAVVTARAGLVSLVAIEGVAGPTGTPLDLATARVAIDGDTLAFSTPTGVFAQRGRAPLTAILPPKRVGVGTEARFLHVHGKAVTALLDDGGAVGLFAAAGPRFVPLRVPRSLAQPIDADLIAGDGARISFWQGTALRQLAGRRVRTLSTTVTGVALGPTSVHAGDRRVVFAAVVPGQDVTGLYDAGRRRAVAAFLPTAASGLADGNGDGVDAEVAVGRSALVAAVRFTAGTVRRALVRIDTGP